MGYLVAALLAWSLAIIPNVVGLPTPALDASSGPSPPNYPLLTSPGPGQRLSRGKSFRFTYSNGATSATASQFALANATGLFVLATDLPLSKGKVNRTFTLPKWVADGTYDFVAFENDGFTADGSAYTDVVISTVFVGPRPVLSAFAAPGPVIPGGQPSKLKKREPHLPKFHSPGSNQSVICGNIVQIKFVDGEVDTDQVQFVLRKIGANDSSEDVVLTSPSSPTGLFNFTGYTVAANVSFPTSIDEGHYTLVAQEFYPEDPSPFFDAASISVKVMKETKPSKTSRAAVRRSVPLSSGDSQTATAAAPEAGANSTATNLTDCQKLSEVAASDQSKATAARRRIRRSAAMIQPHPSQMIFMGTDFKVKISDPNAKKEDVVFVMRSFTGRKYDLGNATFKNGVASAIVTCPKVTNSDTWLVEAKVNSAKRPKVFLTVVSTSVIVTLGPIINAPVVSRTERKRAPHPAELVKPVLNENFTLGETFACQLLDGESTNEHVRFVLRFHDGRADLPIGEIDIVDSLANTTCQIPSSLDPGPYTLVAQENSLGAPETFSDAQTTAINVSDLEQEAEELKTSSGDETTRFRRREIVELSTQKADVLNI